MPKVAVYNLQGSQTGEIELSETLFAADINTAVIHQVVRAQLANKRQGTKCTLTRTEVRGGGKKPYRQKGPGRARQGSTRAPQWIKGGVVFAPKSRDFSKKMNATAKKVALFSALSKKVADGEFIVIDELTVSAAKTKEMAAFQKALGLNKSALVVMDNDDVNVIRAAANLPKLETLPLAQLSTYEVVKFNKVVMTKAAVEKFQEVNA